MGAGMPTVHSAFVQGFDIARQSLFKLLREGPPQSRVAAKGNGSQGTGTKRAIQERPSRTPAPEG